MMPAAGEHSTLSLTALPFLRAYLRIGAVLPDGATAHMTIRASRGRPGRRQGKRQPLRAGLIPNRVDVDR